MLVKVLVNYLHSCMWLARKSDHMRSEWVGVKVNYQEYWCLESFCVGGAATLSCVSQLSLTSEACRMPHVHWAMASPTASNPIKYKHPEGSNSQVSYRKQSQELHLALHLLNVPLMSNTRKCGCLKSQRIRFPLSSFLMDMYHILWSKSPLLSGPVTALAHKLSGPPLWCAKTCRWGKWI